MASKKWYKSTMRDAILHCRNLEERDVTDPPYPEPYHPDSGCAVEWFTDGTAVACKSNWSGPHSELTPDVDAKPPEWWIYR